MCEVDSPSHCGRSLLSSIAAQRCWSPKNSLGLLSVFVDVFSSSGDLRVAGCPSDRAHSFGGGSLMGGLLCFWNQVHGDVPCTS
mmetsp:Transcript_13749/g.37630  ORF Transcript_13749/g.37630 Transcript_13749/m.37630 type:complete len:84 (-) Transcript_13749:80-331(-)